MKIPLNISVDQSTAEWVDKTLKNNKNKFRNRSHLVEQAITEYKEKWKQTKD